MNTSLMEINGIACTLNMPPALKSRFGPDGEELDQGLPPYAPRSAFDVDIYDEVCPPEWPRVDGKARSYFVAVKDGHGLWLDFNRCCQHTHDVAVLISVQGVNAVSGMHVTKGGLALEQYRDSCPKHGERLRSDRLCKSCGWKWPPQNYLATTGAPHGMLWLDGFRAADGAVRQFVFTTETSRGVAAQVIGEERTHALSIAFFLSKNPKPPPPPSRYRGGYESDVMLESMGAVPKTLGATRGHRLAAPMEVAAGARVKQQVHQDPKDPDYWEPNYAGILFVNYTDEETARRIIAAATPREDREGFLGGLRTGHDPDPFNA